MKPFVKWAGGKTKLLKRIEQRLPIDFCEWENVTYVEPFVGGGSVLFHMLQTHRNISRAIINDINKVLIQTYLQIQTDPTGIIVGLKSLVDEYNNLKNEDAKSKFYYQTRDLYNKQSLPNEQHIVFFLFLNRTCYNGLYRENKSGRFNVPFGRYDSINFDEKNFFDIQQTLQNVEILCGDFDNVFTKLRGNHQFIYIDPPYRPISANVTMFTQYDKSGFTDRDQMRLKELCDVFGKRGCKIMISNSDSYIDNTKSYFENLYEGYYIDRIQVTRNINPYSAKNRHPKEVIITNYQPVIIPNLQLL